MPRLILAACLVFLTTMLLCSGGPIHEGSRESLHLHKQTAPTLDDRTKCGSNDEWPSTRVNTTQRLIDLREVMKTRGVDAFLVFSDDAHGSEYPPNRDKRRGFISGFTGSAGYAAVTMTKAALWTDGRYFLEAEDALDCNWIFMKQWEAGVPDLTTWLISELTSGQVVGADPFLVTNSQWQSMETTLQAASITLRPVPDNPVDAAWTDQPPHPKTRINALDMKYAGRSWQNKVEDVHGAMKEKRIQGAYIVTSLDEIAWLFNLRAKDIEYNPFFIAYAVIEYYRDSSPNNKVRLYIYDKNTMLTAPPSDSETRVKLHVHLNTNRDGSCAGKTDMCVEVHEYNPSQVVAYIEELVKASAYNKFWVTDVCNYAIFNAILEAQRVQARSYIALAKAQKNPTERQGMENCYNRDSAVLVEFLAKIEKEVTGGKSWSEVSAAAELKRMRLEADKNRGLSFASISASGPNGAVIHYRVGPNTDRQLTTRDMYLLDSGGQYLDGTTDVTRTMHYGTPTAYMKECYTRVLMGCIDLATLVWPEGIYGRQLDILARIPLWAAGLGYRHGTGHGIGAYLSVHEGPGFITPSSRDFDSQETLLPYMYFSDEPGFYENGKFGIRLETILMVDPANTTHKSAGRQYLRFKTITLVPFEHKLIEHSLLTAKHIKWLDAYHQLTLDTIEPLLTSDMAKAWLRKKTRRCPSPTPRAPLPVSV